MDGLSEAFREHITEQLPFAMSKSMNDSLYPTRVAVQKVMANPRAVIQGGATGFTKSRLRYQKSTKYDQNIIIYFKDEAAFMQEIMYGGTKTNKGRKLREPAKDDFSNLNKYGNFGKAYTEKLFNLAAVQRGAPWQSTSGKNFKTKINKGSGGIAFGTSKGGTFGIWDWSKISKKTGRKPKLLMYLGRKERSQKPTAQRLPDLTLTIFETHFRRAIARNIAAATKSSFERKMRKISS